jgi:glycosyltransferase involved in cell wall biosynthesis
VIGDAGVIVDSRDPQAIGVAAGGLLMDPQRLTELGARARRRAEIHFDGERMVEDTLRLYERCLSGQKRRVRERAAPAGVAP